MLWDLTISMLLSTVVRPTCEQRHPKALHPFLPEIYEFMAYNHLNVLHPILR